MAMSQFVNNSPFPLNDDCAQKVFEFLNLEDCMSLAEAYRELQPVADYVIRRNFTDLTLDCSRSINRVLYHAGQSAKSLTLNLNAVHDIGELFGIGETCTELTRLNLNGLYWTTAGWNPFANIITDKLEVLLLDGCVVGDVDFFGPYRKLKGLILQRCHYISAAEISRCFELNPGLTNFLCDNLAFTQVELLQQLPKLKRLSLQYNSAHMKVTSLSKLPSLRYLTLTCSSENVNDILADLATSNTLEHLTLIDIVPDDDTFKLIKNLDNLENLRFLFVMTSADQYFDYPDPADLPTGLQTLEMGGFRLYEDNVKNTIEMLPRLKNLILCDCEVASEDGFWKGDFDVVFEFVFYDVQNIENRYVNISIDAINDNYPPVSFV